MRMTPDRLPRGRFDSSDRGFEAMSYPLTADDVRQRLLRAVEVEGSQRALAKKLGVSAAFLNDILLGKREPSGKPLTFLGLRRDVRYVSL